MADTPTPNAMLADELDAEADAAMEAAHDRTGALPPRATHAAKVLAATLRQAAAALRAPTIAADDARPKVVTLCGSTRFHDVFQEANFRLTMAGNIVLSVGFYPHTKSAHEYLEHGEHVGITENEKERLDDLHKRKIDMSDEIFVLNVGGYIGDSTRSEIEHAEKRGILVRYLEAALATPSPTIAAPSPSNDVPHDAGTTVQPATSASVVQNSLRAEGGTSAEPSIVKAVSDEDVRACLDEFNDDAEINTPETNMRATLETLVYRKRDEALRNDPRVRAAVDEGNDALREGRSTIYDSSAFLRDFDLADKAELDTAMEAENAELRSKKDEGSNDG